MKENNKKLVNVLEAQFVANHNDPKEDLMISVHGSQLEGKKPLVLYY